MPEEVSDHHSAAAMTRLLEAERQDLALMDQPPVARVLEAGATDGGRSYS